MNPDPERGGGQVLVDLALQGGGAHGAFTWGVLAAFSMSLGSASKAYPAPRPGQ